MQPSPDQICFHVPLAAGLGVMTVTCLCQPHLTGTAYGNICPHAKPVSRLRASFQVLEGITAPVGIYYHPSFTERINILSYFETVPKGLKEMQLCQGSTGFPHWCCLKAPFLLLPQSPVWRISLHALLRSHQSWGAHQALGTSISNAFHSFEVP